MALFHPLEEKFVVAGTREEWVKRCEEALRTTPYFQDVASSAELFRVSARYRRPPVWGDIHVTLTPEASGFDVHHRLCDDVPEPVRTGIQPRAENF